MNLTIKINLELFKEISWPIVLIFIAKYFVWFSPQQMFIMYMGLLVALIAFARKIIFPHIRGLIPYLVFTIYSAIIGFLVFETRDVFRDLYYVLPTIVVIILGYYFKLICKNKVSIMKTIVLCGMIVSTTCFIKLLGNISILANPDEIRSNFDSGSYEVIVAFLIVFCSIFTTYKVSLFKKWVNYFCFIIMFAQLLLSLARSVWVETAVGCLLALIIDAYLSRNVLSVVKKIIEITLIATIGVTFFLNTAPQEAIDTFSDKFANTSQELDSEQEFSSTNEAMNNWRGYENKSAKEQWKNNNGIEIIFGQGMGQGIYLKYVPYAWKGMASQNKIPILHNGYYTILIKGGVIGLLTLVWFMLANVLLGFRLLKRREDIQFDLIVLIIVEILFMVQTYVVRGPVAQTVNYVTAIMIGWISANINRGNKKIASVEKSEE